MDKKKKKYQFPPIIYGREAPVADSIYPVVDNDLARDNIENDLTSADLQDLY